MKIDWDRLKTTKQPLIYAQGSKSENVYIEAWDNIRNYFMFLEKLQKSCILHIHLKREWKSIRFVVLFGYSLWSYSFTE